MNNLLVKDAGQAWKWFSMWAMGVPAAVAAVWLLLPAPLQQAILTSFTPKQLAWAALIILGAGMIGRLINQGSNPA